MIFQRFLIIPVPVSGIINISETGGKSLPQVALELPFRELRDQILDANHEIEEIKKQLNRIAMENEDLLKEKNNLQEQVDYLKKEL